ncbi:MAG: UDP-N-acetylmuramoyl-tripeptide--D-alanyl-D-alanine ligase [Bacteroidia bacterium]|nr:UDP-N-acetylmuramoyl-tripeptide--D-alanyl-D-alanine ligase [Bacteroidia bacterium]
MELDSIYQIFLTCSGITTDSRHCPKNSLFIALKGEAFNGNLFAEKALKTGSSYAIVDDPTCIAEGDKRYLLVEDALTTLQQLAHYHRQRIGIPVIGITGTNGKTTTKELIAAVLSQSYKIWYTQGNLNNHIGVPLTLLQLKPEHQLAVIEMGANHPGEIKLLAEIADPNYGLITNVGKAHLEGFGSFEGVIQTKGELYTYLRNKKESTIFIHNDNEFLKAIATELKQITYGSSPQLNVTGRLSGKGPFLAFEWHTDSDLQERLVNTKLIGDYNLPNALAAITIGSFFQVEPNKICDALEAYTPQNNRSQLKETEKNRLIIDAYNANPTSMMAAITNFKNMEATNKMLILGDMRELGLESFNEHQKIADHLEASNFKNVWLVGEQFAAIHHPFKQFATAQEVIEHLEKEPVQHQTILIKGSNGIKLHTLVDYL